MPSNNTTITLPVQGMHCASCVSVISRTLQKIPGVTSCTVNLATEKAHITFDPSTTSTHHMNEALKPQGYSLIDEATSVSSMNHMQHNDGSHMNAPHIMIIALFTFTLMMWDIASLSFTQVPPIPVPMPIFIFLMFAFATYILVISGAQFLQAVFRFIKTGRANMDTLVGLGAGTAYFYSLFVYLFPIAAQRFQLPTTLYFDVVTVVVGFIVYGKHLEAISKQKTGEALQQLMALQAKTALVLRNKIEIEVPIEDVRIGDLLVVKPGTKIPLDGIVLQGMSSIDESLVTGESMPVDKKKNDSVIGGTMNQQGALLVQTTKIGKDTVLAHIAQLVEEAQTTKAPIERLADQISSVFVPIVLVIAFGTLIAWLTIAPQYIPFQQAFSLALTCFVGILVIACPCALGLATPTAMIVAVGRGAKQGILIKDAESLEKLHKTKVVVMDKTGTLTNGKPIVTDIVPAIKYSASYVLGLAASLEKNSEHPLAHAVLQKAEADNVPLQHVQKFLSIQGKGVKAVIATKTYLLGNQRLLEEYGIQLPNTITQSSYLAQGKTPMYLASEKSYIGVLYLADTLKDNAQKAVQRLHKLGIKVVMLTGDLAEPAQYIAKQAGIDNVISHVLPHEKAQHVSELKAQYHQVTMVGDGVNDAPALATADVGVAMSTGTDIAISTANMTLLKGDLEKLADAIILSRKTMSIIKQNLFWAFFYNIVGIPLAAGVLYPFFGILLNPIFAGLAMALSSVSVVTNSLRLRSIKLH